MTIAQRIGHTVATADTQAKAADFVSYAKGIAGRGYGLPPERVRSRVADLLKASPVSAGALVDPNWSALGDYTVVAAAWLETLRTISVFDAALPAMKRVPLNSRIVAAASAVTGSTPAEREVKPISSFTLEADAIAPRKSAALIVVSKELFELSGNPGTQLFGSELANGVSIATDRIFLSSLYASVTPTASSGVTVAAVFTDLAALMGALTAGSRSRVFIVMGADNALALMTKQGANGTAFPNVALNGGEILRGVPLLVSDAVPSGAIIALDATSFAGNTELPILQSARHANIQMDTAPDSPATASTATINLWQQNMIGLLAERDFGWTVFRSGAVAAISGANYAASGDSP